MSLAFSPDGRRLLCGVGRAPYLSHVWDAATASEVASYGGTIRPCACGKWRSKTRSSIMAKHGRRQRLYPPLPLKACTGMDANLRFKRQGRHGRFRLRVNSRHLLDRDRSRTLNAK
jgi:hypothetical protein